MCVFRKQSIHLLPKNYSLLRSKRPPRYSDAIVKGKRNDLAGLKENLIVGHLIAAGTCRRTYQNMQINTVEEIEAANARRMAEPRKREYVD